jgi:hypothetical protein
MELSLDKVYDHIGHEIYRAKLQPHHNEYGHVAYVVDSEYGIKHPAFTKSSHEVVKKLSGKYKSGVFKKYNAEHLHKALNDKDKRIKQAAAKNLNANKYHLERALNDENERIRKAAKENPNYRKYFK